MSHPAHGGGVGYLQVILVIHYLILLVCLVTQMHSNFLFCGNLLNLPKLIFNPWFPRKFLWVINIYNKWRVSNDLKVKEKCWRSHLLHHSFINLVRFLLYQPRRVKSFAMLWSFALVCSAYFTKPKQQKPCQVLTVVGSVMIVGALSRCAWFYSLCDLKTALMNVDHSTVSRCSRSFARVARICDDQAR